LESPQRTPALLTLGGSIMAIRWRITVSENKRAANELGRSQQNRCAIKESDQADK
jgi:hypothetical protein